MIVLDPSNLRVGIAGNILELASPKKVLADKFLPIKESKPLNPISLSSATLSELGKNPSSKVCFSPVMGSITNAVDRPDPHASY
jgi:hypothetical protein